MPLWKDPRTGKYRYQFQYQQNRGRKSSDGKTPGGTGTATESDPTITLDAVRFGLQDPESDGVMVKHLRLAERELIPSTVSY